MTAGVSGIPVSDVDLFADAALDDPYPLYAELRRMGGAVWLSRPGVWAVPRHEEVARVLRCHDVFSSVGGPALVPVEDWLLTGVIVSTDPPEHDRYRALINVSVAPRALRKLRVEIEQRADRLVEDVVGRGSFDAIADLAQRLPVDVVGDLIGLPCMGRDRLLEMLDATANFYGPLNERAQAGTTLVKALWEYLATVADTGAFVPGSWGAGLYEAVARGEIDKREALSLLASYVGGGMNTTVHAIGSAIWLLATHADQWAALRADPGLARAAFEETLRLESPVQRWFRAVASDCELGGVPIKRGQRVMIMLGSANRDERRWTDADVFDITRNPSAHLAFGRGVHGCVGQALARIEGPAILASLARRARSIELADEPARNLNSIVRGLERLPVTVTQLPHHGRANGPDPESRRQPDNHGNIEAP